MAKAPQSPLLGCLTQAVRTLSPSYELTESDVHVLKQYLVVRIRLGDSSFSTLP